MDTRTLILVILILLVVGAVLWFYFQKQKTRKLRLMFGSEYDRVLQETGGRRKAEALLIDRKKHVERLAIRPLVGMARTRFANRWHTCQATFVDDPRGAVRNADHLVREVMEMRGYPVGDFDERVADISVDHPEVVENFRAAHEIAIREQRGEASTEDLRRAFVYYKTLFEELLGISESALREAK